HADRGGPRHGHHDGHRELRDGASSLPGVVRVDAATGSYVRGHQVAPPSLLSARFAAPDATWFSAIPSVEPLSSAGESLVQAIRAQPAPFPVRVGGSAAQLVDSRSGIFSRVPLAAALIGLVQ